MQMSLVEETKANKKVKKEQGRRKAKWNCWGLHKEDAAQMGREGNPKLSFSLPCFWQPLLLSLSPPLSHVLSLFLLFVLTCFCHLFCLSRCALLFITNYYYVLLSVGHLLSPAISFTQHCSPSPLSPAVNHSQHTHTVLLLAFLTWHFPFFFFGCLGASSRPAFE